MIMWMRLLADYADPYRRISADALLTEEKT